MTSIDPFDSTRIALAGTRYANIRFAETTGSTNDDIACLLGEPHGGGTTIVSDYQLSGSGRKGRSWVAAPRSGLLFTTALPDPLTATDLWAVPFWVGLALRSALASLEVATTLQWPNDVLLGDRKLGGILCVSRVTGADAWVGCGVGINVARPPAGSPGAAQLARIAPPPAFCSDARHFDRAELLAAILRVFEATGDLLRAPQHVARRFEAAAGLPGARYRMLVDATGETIEGEALALGRTGSLVLATDAGQREVTLADARVMR